ncbi:MAG: cobaltochelatase subunit CobN [Scytonematopsis contorta HA4267-MV1]|jgi:cobaltochelatase CobN|nr:cobaltochelatase subunit CobN [Scytonematopsis contorta HA4267-MV1]
MHRTSTTSGGWNQSGSLDGTNISLEQTPAPVVFLTSADTDIQTTAVAFSQKSNTWTELRVANLLQLQNQLSIDTYAEQVLEFAQVIILRLLGGRSYWSYGLEVVQEIVQRNGINLIVIPGDDALDLDLMSNSTLPQETAMRVWRYFNEGGVENIVNAFNFISDQCLSTTFNPPAPQVIPRVGLYDFGVESGEWGVGVLFYRAHYLSGNTTVIDAICQALIERNLKPVPVFVSSLREEEVQRELIEFFQPKDEQPISLLLNTTSFSLARLDTERPQLELWEKLDVPVFQVILSSSGFEQWKEQNKGLSPRDMAINVALPEVDGRIITRAVSFKTSEARNTQLETDVVVYKPIPERIQFVADLAANWVRLRSKAPSERRIALILANYPNRDGRLANGVGLDTPASCVEILKALHFSGYHLENYPKSSEELIELLTSGITNDPEGKNWRPIQQSLSEEEYTKYFISLPEKVQQGINERWGNGCKTDVTDDWESKIISFSQLSTPHSALPIPNSQLPTPNSPLPTPHSPFPIPGIQLGNIFVGIQPVRGYDVDPNLNYHAPDLEPTHDYLAFYYWVKRCFAADAVVHVGKHGNLEWLPGKSIALSSNCYPEVALGALPHLYPFIVNDPGEGSQAKRRAQAVIIDHLTPPLTRAELYGALQKLENLVDEYYEAETLDPTRLPLISERITELVLQENLHRDLGLELELTNASIENQRFQIQNFLNRADAYLCELKEAQIRDGLHIFGKCPTGRQLRDLIIAIARQPNPNNQGLTRAISQDWGLDIDPLTDNFSNLLSTQSIQILAEKTQKTTRTVGDAVTILEEHAITLVEEILKQSAITDYQLPITNYQLPITNSLDWIKLKLLPGLEQTDREIIHLLRGLEGRYVKSAPSGAPTRGRPEVLPTGNNFYSVDIRALPTEVAWDVGRKAAENLIECYAQENGEYPKTLGLSMWGTATMRTGGDDIAQALALLGVRPVWDGVARRVVDFEILPISVLGRPRVDVTLRVSGFFRDAFKNLIDLFDQAVIAVAALDEHEADNPLAAQVCQDTEFYQQQGFSEKQAQQQACYRIFSSKGGAYGAGLGGLINSQNWENDEDLARAYLNWGCFAYTSSNEGEEEGIFAPLVFEQRLKQMQVVLQNQDNREHDLLDSDDYYQFQGGLTLAVRSLTGKNPTTYFGDNSIPAKPRVRKLKEEIARVYRSRVINPKWITSCMRHGYKGAFEMAATVDYLFAYDATAKCVEDHMYQGVAEAYVFDSTVASFIEEKNPWALRDIAERLLESHQRGLWQDVNIQTLDNLRNLVHQAEAAIEQKQMV